MFSRNRHYPVRDITWNADFVAAAIERIAEQSLDCLRKTGSCPPHPQDDFAPANGFYFGVPGVLWALNYLKDVNAVEYDLDFLPLLEEQLVANRRGLKATSYPENASYLFGELPILMLQFKLSGDKAIADDVFATVEKNNSQPVRELMWGVPGSMLAAKFMFHWTDESRWKEVFLLQAEKLMTDWQEVETCLHLWSPELYGSNQKYLGPVHGFAGNVIPLIEGKHFFTEEKYAEICTKVFSTVVRTAIVDEEMANWPVVFGEKKTNLVQHCHGAPGMITALARLPSGHDEDFDEIMKKGGELVWQAGPMKKGSNLCHGTGGNGYALLKLFERTGHRVWLDRARSFAMNAIDQFELSIKLYRQARHTLWTGDPGLAIYLWDCIREEAEFPTIEVF